MFRWRKVRKANVPKDVRDVCERIGETVIAMVLAGGLTPHGDERAKIHTYPVSRDHAGDWLIERGDKDQQHEERLECAEWAILIFVILVSSLTQQCSCLGNF